MTSAISNNSPARLPTIKVDVGTPKSEEQDQALAMQDAAARTGENAPRAGTHLENLQSPIDRFVQRAD